MTLPKKSEPQNKKSAVKMAQQQIKNESDDEMKDEFLG